MKFCKSIQWQLQIWQMLLLAVVLSTLFSLHYHLHRRELITATDMELRNTLMYTLPVFNRVLDQVRMEPLDRAGRPGMRGRQNPLVRPGRTPLGEKGRDILHAATENNLYACSWNTDGELLKSFGDVPESLRFETYASIQRENPIVTREGHRELALKHLGEQLIIIGRSLKDIDQQMAVLFRKLWAIGAAIMVIGFVGGWLMIRRTLRPIHKISETANEISQGERSRRIELASAPEELASLAGTLNSTFDHLDAAIETQKRFSADASHELRTPISVIIAQTQAALKRDRSTDEYKRILNSCLRAGQRMKNLANSLLDLTSLDGKAGKLNKSKCNLNELLAEVASSTALLSEKHPVSYKKPEQPIYITIDEDRIDQVVTNLIDNAIKHNPAGCSIELCLSNADGCVQITIEDSGIGVSKNALPHVFERFYREDSSRSRERGGAGLGLSIVKSLVEAHGGSITVSSQEELFTTFTIILPLWPALPPAE